MSVLGSLEDLYKTLAQDSHASALQAIYNKGVESAQAIYNKTLADRLASIGPVTDAADSPAPAPAPDTHDTPAPE